jgi:putative heme iron utilization protein
VSGHDDGRPAQAGPGATDGPRVPAPSHAERSRTLASLERRGALGTVARDPAGYPYTSLVIYGLDEGGHPLFLLSSLAEHTRNLLADSRGSLLVTEPLVPGGDPLALARVTLLGRLALVPEAEREAAGRCFFAAHPGTEYYLGMKDFAFYRLGVESLRYIGGYGRMSWVGAQDYLGAQPDPLAPMAAGILGHMNQDHGAALLGYARAFAGHPDATAAVMTAIDRYGFEMTVTTPAGPKPARLGFPAPIATSEEARRELVRLAHEARAKLG